MPTNSFHAATTSARWLVPLLLLAKITEVFLCRRLICARRLQATHVIDDALTCTKHKNTDKPSNKATTKVRIRR
jgi:hypothetical protein